MDFLLFEKQKIETNLPDVLFARTLFLAGSGASCRDEERHFPL